MIAVILFPVDFDGDSFLGKVDLSRTIGCLTRSELSQEEIDFICEKVSL